LADVIIIAVTETVIQYLTFNAIFRSGHENKTIHRTSYFRRHPNPDY